MGRPSKERIPRLIVMRTPRQVKERGSSRDRGDMGYNSVMTESQATIQLVRVETADGLFLEGALQRLAQTGPLPVDAFLLLHGTGSNFYAPGVLETFAGQALAHGTAVLRINTRGHDGTCSIPGRKGSVKGGATFERVADCPLDVTAWINWLAVSGFARIVLVGHSMGGVKAIYSQAYSSHPSVRGIVGISPPRFAHERLLTGLHGETFREEFLRASELVARGQGDALLSVTQPLPFVATAAGYVEKYGPENRYDYVPLLPRVPCAALILIGSESIRTSAAFNGSPEAIATAAAGQATCVCEIVEGANINYAGCDKVPFLHAADWLWARAAGNVACIH
ncbi:MAG: alpha/beta hydrolase [Deltaproteobacteria bacterium]